MRQAELKQEEEDQMEQANEENEEEEDRETPGEGDGEGEDDMQMDDEDDSVEYEVFYNSKDIHEALTKQQEDKFIDLVSTKKKLLKECEKKLMNRFNIMDWAPEEPTDDQANLKKLKRGRSIVNQMSEQDNDDDEMNRILQQNKQAELNLEEQKHKQTKLLHKVEQDQLKSEIESMVFELDQNKQATGGKGKNSDSKSQEGS